ncbi:MAG: hypothetical protein ACMZI0_08850, partial [Symbiopectobacterium sp.]
ELGTIVTALFMNNAQSAIRNVQAEIIAIMTDVGVSTDPTKSDQLLAALKKNFVLQARKINNKTLNADITLGAGDIGAYTIAETDTALDKKVNTTQLQKSQDDTTAGAVVINGGHGLGANARPRTAGLLALPGAISLVTPLITQITLSVARVRQGFMCRKLQHMAGTCWSAMAAALILECAKLLMALQVSGQGCGQAQTLLSRQQQLMVPPERYCLMVLMAGLVELLYFLITPPT